MGVVQQAFRKVYAALSEENKRDCDNFLSRLNAEIGGSLIARMDIESEQSDDVFISYKLHESGYGMSGFGAFASLELFVESCKLMWPDCVVHRRVADKCSVDIHSAQGGLIARCVQQEVITEAKKI